MDAQDTVLASGTVWIVKGGIAAVTPEGSPAPAGFESVRPVETAGTIFPGLIELHSHLAYNVLRLWDVPKLYTNRDQWGGTPEYQRLISGPMKVLGSSPELMPAIVRYVEVKCLVGGVTTSQGIELFSNRGARRYYRGIVRNVEQTDDPGLPEASAKIADVEAADAERFLARLARSTCFLLHLSEGTDQKAREHFLALKLMGGDWAIKPALSGIHCAALEPADFHELAAGGGAMVWSPLSNLLLYGATARVAAAKAEGIRIGIGSDWSPSGSKNLLGELKVGRLVSHAEGDVFSDRDLVAMATREAARILGWQQALGSLEAGKRADLLVVAGVEGDPYAQLLGARESNLALVMINGVARCGEPSLMRALGADGEPLLVGGSQRLLNLEQRTEDPVTAAISFAQARDRLSAALSRLPDLASERLAALVSGPAGPLAGPAEPTWYLALDELEQTGMELRHRLPFGQDENRTGPALPTALDLQALAVQLQPLQLDALTAIDDGDLLDRIGRQRNLPAYVAPGLRQLYGGG